MSLFNTLSINVYSRIGGDYGGDDNDWIPGGLSETPTPIKGTWVIAPGKIVETVEEGRRTGGVYILTTSTPLNIVDQDNGQESDIVISPVDGKQYELLRDLSSLNNILNHRAYLAVRVKEAG